MCCVKGAQISTHSCQVEVQRIHCKADKCFGKQTPVESVCMCVDVDPKRTRNYLVLCTRQLDLSVENTV